jgi:hypothetical protein
MLRAAVFDSRSSTRLALAAHRLGPHGRLYCPASISSHARRNLLGQPVISITGLIVAMIMLNLRKLRMNE